MALPEPVSRDAMRIVTFVHGVGTGVSAEDIAHSLDIRMALVSTTLDMLVGEGYLEQHVAFPVKYTSTGGWVPPDDAA